MHSLLKVLMLLVLVFSPCAIGCSSRMSEEEAERIEAEQDADSGEMEDGAEEADE